MNIIKWIIKLINKFKEVLTLLEKKKGNAKGLTDLNVILPITNSNGKYIFYCPGCVVNHLISTTPKSGTYHTLTGTLAKPPSGLLCWHLEPTGVMRLSLKE